MKPNELTPEALLTFFSELESSDEGEEECEIHYGCSCVIRKGRKAAQMLLDVQKVLGVEPGTAEPARDEDAEMTAQIMEVERALSEPDQSPEPDPNAEALSEAEGEIDRLLVQNVELKEQNEKFRAKMRDLYKQIERLHTRQEMSKLLGTLDEKIEEEAKSEDGEEDEGGSGEEDAPSETGKTGAEVQEPADASEVSESESRETGESETEADTASSDEPDEGSGEREEGSGSAGDSEAQEAEPEVSDEAEEADLEASDEIETPSEAERDKN